MQHVTTYAVIAAITAVLAAAAYLAGRFRKPHRGGPDDGG